MKPLAVIVAHATHAQEPAWFSTAPVGAIEKLLRRRAGRRRDVDLFEINEAFAVVTMAAMKEHGIPHDKVNVHGGACALGHPIGASGARILVTLIGALRKQRQEARRRVAVHRRRRGDGDGDRTRLRRGARVIPLATWLLFVLACVALVATPGPNVLVPRVAHACAGPRGRLRLARRHVDRLPVFTRWRRPSDCRRFSPRCRSPTTRSASPGAIYLAWLAWSTWRSPEQWPSPARLRGYRRPAVSRRPGDGGPQSEGRDVPARALPAVRRSVARQRARAEPGARRDAARHRRGGRFALRPRGRRRAPLVRGASGWSAGRGGFSPASSRRSPRGSRWTIGGDRARIGWRLRQAHADGAVLGRHVRRRTHRVSRRWPR